MGVKDLQFIIKNYGIPASQAHYKAAVFDGNNLFFMKIAGVVSRLYKANNIEVFKGFSINIIEQLNSIIHSVTNECLRVIDYTLYRDNVDEIYLVFDPVSSPIYNITADMEYFEGSTLGDSDYRELILGEDDSIAFNIKLEEQEKRKEAQMKRQDIDSIIKLIDKIDVTEDVKNIFKSIATQSNYFNNASNYIKLMPIVIGELYKNISNKLRPRIHFIQSTVEADLTIKNLAESLITNDSDNVLVLSSDTDYFILFGDSDNVYCRSLAINNLETYNPKQVFINLFGKNYSYDAVIRLAPLLGNDYTVKECISSAKDVENILSLMNISKRFNPLMLTTCKARKIKNIIVNNSDNMYLAKMLTKMTKPSLDLTDEIILNYDVDYFKRYLISILIYKNISAFDNQYAEFEMTENEIKAEYKVIQDLLKSIFDTIYDWQYDISIYEASFQASFKVIDVNYDTDYLYEIISKYEEKPTVVDNEFDSDDLPSMSDD